MMDRMSSMINRDKAVEPQPRQQKPKQPEITTPKTVMVQCFNCDAELALHDLTRIYYGVCGECGYAYVVLKK